MPDNKEFDFFTFDKKPTSESKYSPNDFFSIPSTSTWVKPEKPSISEQLKTAPGLFARKGIASVYSLPSTIAETGRFIGGKLQKLGEEQAAKEGREITPEESQFTENIVNYIPDLVQKAGEKFPKLFPTFKQAEEAVTPKIEETIGHNLPEKGRGFIERAAEGAGNASLFGITPAAPLVGAAAIGTSALTEGLDLSEGKKLIGNLSVPAATSLIQAIARKRYIPSPGEAEALFNRGKQLGLTEEQLAPVLATEGQVARHSGQAAGTRRARESFRETGEALGNTIEQLPNRPQAQIPITSQAENTLIQKFNDIEDSIRNRTLNLSPKERELADFIRDTRNSLASNGATPAQLIGTWRSINKIGAGRTELRKLMEPLTEAISSVSPELAQDLVTTNRLYSRYLTNLGEINPTQFNAFMDAGELQNMLGTVFSGSFQQAGKGVLRTLSGDALKRISARILTDPRAQSLSRNLGKAIRDGRNSSARAVGNQFKEYIKKEFPEEYKEIEWEELTSHS